MNQRITKLLAIAALASAGLLNAKSLNHYMGKGVSNNMAMEIINTSKAYACGDECEGWFGNFTVEGFYNGSFNNKKATGVGSLMSFGGSTTNEMSVGTPAAAAAVTTLFNVDAYQFGLGNLSTASTGKMKIEPKMYSAGANLMLFVGANRAETGFWFKANGAVGVQSVDPQLTESGALPTATSYADNTFGSATAIATTSLYKNMKEAFAAKTAISTEYKQLKYGKIDGKKTTGAKFGDINVTLGYNFVANDTTVVGVGVRGLIPTANKPTAEHALEPIFGHGGNWAVGGELFVKTTLWSSDESDKSLNFYLNGHASHYFKAEQTRSFDTTLNQDGSRYLLVARYNNNSAVATQGASSAEFKGEVANLINYSTLTANSTVSVEGAAAALLDFNCGNWNMGAGVEFWGSAKEKLAITGTLPTDLVILGRQFVGRNAAAVAGGLCQPGATMTSQEAQVAIAAVGGTAATTTLPYAGLAASKIKASDLNAESAANDARHSVKAFANVGYKWMDSSYCPFLGLTGSADFATSKRNAASHWGVAVQGGLCF
jgi:hypothetical protein